MRDQAIEVGHGPGLPEKRPAPGPADHLAGGVDAESLAREVAGQRAEVLRFVLVPEDGTGLRSVRAPRPADHLAAGIDAQGLAGRVAGQGAEILAHAGLPEKRPPIERRRQQAGVLREVADHLARGVDVVGPADRPVAGAPADVLHGGAVLPEERVADPVASHRLRLADHLPVAVDGVGRARSVPGVERAGAVERPERAHEKSGAEGGQRGHQRGELVAGGKELRRDGLGVVAVDHEVVHLEEVAARDADDGADLGVAFLSGEHRFLSRHLCVSSWCQRATPQVSPKRTSTSLLPGCAA